MSVVILENAAWKVNRLKRKLHSIFQSQMKTSLKLEDLPKMSPSSLFPSFCCAPVYFSHRLFLSRFVYFLKFLSEILSYNSIKWEVSKSPLHLPLSCLWVSLPRNCFWKKKLMKLQEPPRIRAVGYFPSEWKVSLAKQYDACITEEGGLHWQWHLNLEGEVSQPCHLGQLPGCYSSLWPILQAVVCVRMVRMAKRTDLQIHVCLVTDS